MNNISKISQYYEEIGILSKETILDAFQKNCIKYPNKIAVIDEDRQLTYKQLDDEIARFAGGLVVYGIGKNDKVLIQMANGIPYLIILFAIMKVGAVPILLLQEHRSHEIETIAKAVNSSVLIIEYNELVQQWSDMIVKIISQLPSIKLVVSDCPFLNTKVNAETITFEQLKSINRLENNYCHYHDIALCLLSGGTTGMPKIIPKVQQAYLYNARAAAERCRINEKTVYLAVLSVSHDLALANPGILGTLLSGGRIVLSKSASFDDAFTLIDQYKVTVTCIVPALAAIWVDALAFSDNDLSSLKQILIGASKLDRKLGKQLIDKFGVKLQQGYGLGEGVTCFTCFEDDEETSINTQGTPISKYDEIKIVDLAGREVEDGEVGELIGKGPYTFLGYYHNDELNKEVFTKDGFFRTGDKAKKDQRGNIIILGRVREQINKAGENIIPAEIESFLRNCPNIKNASVFGMPDEKRGEKIVACVIADMPVNKKILCAYLTQMGVSAVKFPDELIQVNNFPYKNIGKVDKEKLKKQILLRSENER